MQSYVKKPVQIQAVQLTETNIKEAYTFIHKAPDINCDMAADRWQDYEAIVTRDGLKMMTLESDGQTQTANIGDFIIKGIQGEFYPCKPDIFYLTYDICEDK